MDAIDRLMNEHRQIETALDELEKTAETLQPGALKEKARVGSLVAFFADFADVIHHGKEEKLLFPRLWERGLPKNSGPIGVMLAEHEQGRELIANMRRQIEQPGALTAEQTSELIASARQYIGLLRGHIAKEDQVLYVLARGILPDGAMHMLSEACAAHDQTHAEKIAVLLALVSD